MAFTPASGYELDGYDIYGTWGIKVRKITGLHQALKRKGEIMQTWPDADGDEAFTESSDIYFEGRDIILHGIIIATTNLNFRLQWTGFQGQLQSSGLHTLEVPYESTVYSLMYVTGSDIDWKTGKSKSNKYIGEFWIRFREPSPSRS